MIGASNPEKNTPGLTETMRDAGTSLTASSLMAGQMLQSLTSQMTQVSQQLLQHQRKELLKRKVQLEGHTFLPSDCAR